MAKRRLADEYDAAQDRGDVQSRGGDGSSKRELPTAADIGLTHKEIHEARQIRNAERDRYPIAPRLPPDRSGRSNYSNPLATHPSEKSRSPCAYATRVPDLGPANMPYIWHGEGAQSGDRLGGCQPPDARRWRLVGLILEAEERGPTHRGAGAGPCHACGAGRSHHNASGGLST